MEKQNRRRRASESVESHLSYETEHDKMETDGDLKFLKDNESDKVYLMWEAHDLRPVGLPLGRIRSPCWHSCSPQSSVALALLSNSIFIDSDASHFKVILNYLRYNWDIIAAVFPRS